MAITTSDRIRGLLFGLTAGDQIGGPIRMAMELSKSLLLNNSFDEKSVLRHYYAWWDTAGFDTGYVAHNVFQKMKQGKLNHEAVEEVHHLTGEMTGGCNPMHRAFPLVLLNPTFVEVISQATKDAKLTHYDPIAGECSYIALLICWYMLRHKTLNEALLTISLMPKIVPPYLSLGIVEAYTVDAIKPDHSTPLSDSGYSPDVLRAAIHFLLTNDSFESALSASIAFAGAANFCPVVVGAIAGVQYGYTAIPDHFIKHPTLIDELDDIANQFIERWIDQPE